ncbi:MAG: hypothetical protein V1735_01855 [Nanoarchaeota archaeon]
MQGFSGQKVAPQPLDAQREASSNAARLRMLEERVTNMRRKLQVMEQNMVAMHRNQGDELRTLKTDLQGMKNDIGDIKNTVKLIAAELSTFAKREELLTVQKYLAYWEPIHFVTQEQAEKIARRAIDDSKG